MVACFTADAVLKSPVIDLKGADAIRAFAGRFAAQRGAGTQFRHMVTNIAAEIEAGGDRARATAYLLVLISKDGAHRTLPPGRYECDLVKEGGKWRFSRRVVFHDHDYTLEGSARTAGASLGLVGLRGGLRPEMARRESRSPQALLRPALDLAFGFDCIGYSLEVLVIDQLCGQGWDPSKSISGDNDHRRRKRHRRFPANRKRKQY